PLRRPTPLPYTTLFRSEGQGRPALRPEGLRVDAEGELGVEPAPQGAPRAGAVHQQLRGFADHEGQRVSPRLVAPGEPLFAPPVEDRKSTRLNSSHVKIS